MTLEKIYKGCNNMPSDAQKKANRKWDKENMITLGCKVYRSDAELFKEYAADKGKTSNTLLKEYVIECIKDKKQSDSTDNR